MPAGKTRHHIQSQALAVSGTGGLRIAQQVVVLVQLRIVQADAAVDDLQGV